MPLCKKCDHPHGWYDGLCAACANAAGMKVELGVIPGAPATTPQAEIISSVRTDVVITEAGPEEQPRRRGRRKKT